MGSYPAFGAYPANCQGYNLNAPGFTQEELANYYHNYLASVQEPVDNVMPTHKICHSLNDGPMPSLPVTNKKLPNATKPLQRKKKGCCGC